MESLLTYIYGNIILQGCEKNMYADKKKYKQELKCFSVFPKNSAYIISASAVFVKEKE